MYQGGRTLGRVVRGREIAAIGAGFRVVFADGCEELDVVHASNGGPPAAGLDTSPQLPPQLLADAAGGCSLRRLDANTKRSMKLPFRYLLAACPFTELPAHCLTGIAARFSVSLAAWKRFSTCPMPWRPGTLIRFSRRCTCDETPA